MQGATYEFKAHANALSQARGAEEQAVHSGALHGLSLALLANMIYPLATTTLALRALNVMYQAATGESEAPTPLKHPVVQDTREALEEGRTTSQAN